MSLDQPDVWIITPGSNEPMSFAFIDAGGPEDLSGQVFTLFIAWGAERLEYATTDADPLLTFGDQTIVEFTGILVFATPLQLTRDLPASTPITFEVWRLMEGIETPEHTGIIVLTETVK